MNIVNEIDITEEQHLLIEVLRNQSFPDHKASRSYFKQLPHMRALHYDGDQLVGYLGLDYRVIKVGDDVHKVLGIIDFCVEESFRGQGIGSLMLSEVESFAENKDVDFIILVSDLHDFYSAKGFRKLRILILG
nr:GNAT family N-acetyltransferase [uncultured Vibrio sp.]